MNSKKTIALTGGGTGGHVFPLLSVYKYFKEEDKYNFIWVGEQDWLEDEVAQKTGIDFYDIPAGKIRRYFDWRNFYEPLKNITGIFFGIYYILKYHIDIVFSKGGYVSLPLCIAGFILRKDIYIHESDAVWGVANRLISLLATKVFYSFENKKTNIDKDKEIEKRKHVFSWQILNPELLDYITNLDVSENDKLEVLVIAGSQWSTTIFENLLKIMPDLWDINLTVILGDKNLHFKEQFHKHFQVTVYDFVDQKTLWKIYKKTDIAITRAGATTLWELNNFGIHSIIIPLKNSANNHQQINAEYFNKNFWSNILDEYHNLSLEVFRLLQEYKALRKNGLNLNKFFKALKIITSNIEK
jgi:UDP-N-acetylglucosamine--N-acetylmuramyl-(pentapeptide) pyrophosphoryl-undecaprenol N-acetylglucosamine transferase